MQKKIVNDAFSRAYEAWFSEYDAERRRQRKRKGSNLAGFPAPPTSPEDIAKAVDQVGTRISYTAREIAGWQYVQAHAAALARRVAALEKENAHLVSVGDFGAANDPLMATA